MKFLAIVILLVFSASPFASPLPDFPFVTVTGESVRKVQPDMVTIRFYVVTFDKEASAAQSLLNNTSKEVLNILEANNVLDKNITAFDVDKRIKRAKDKEYNQLAILGYEFTRRFEVNIADLTNYSDITNALLDTNNVGNIESSFDISTREQIEVELITDAAKQAKQKAEQMAAGLGVKIGSVFAFNDTGSFSAFFSSFKLNEEFRGFSQQHRSRHPMNLFIPQFIEVSKSINVVYKIEN